MQDKGTSYDLLWHNTDVTSVGSAPASLVEQTLYVQENEGDLFALNATDGTLLWKAAANPGASLAPAVTGGMVYQATDSNVLRAWADPALFALLGAPSSPPSASPSPQVPDPFTVTATYPWFQTGIQAPAAIAIGSDGMLYVLHAKGNGHEDASSRPTVSVIDRKTGRPIRSWGEYGTGPGQLDLTSTDDNPAWGCIQVASDGLVYVGEEGNHRVEVFKPDGTLVRQIGVGKLGKVQYCILGPDGSLYAVNTWEGTNDVMGGPTARQMSKFSPSGELVWQGYADPEHPSVEADQVGGIAFLPDGHILGFNGQGGVLIDPAIGRVVGQWGSQQTQLGPDESFVSLDPAGNVYLNNRVFDPQGRLLYDKRGPIGEDQGWFGENGCSLSFWPPPVFDKDGFGYSFDCDGLVQLKVTLPGG